MSICLFLSSLYPQPFILKFTNWLMRSTSRPTPDDPWSLLQPSLTCKQQKVAMFLSCFIISNEVHYFKQVEFSTVWYKVWCSMFISLFFFIFFLLYVDLMIFIMNFWKWMKICIFMSLRNMRKNCIFLSLNPIKSRYLKKIQLNVNFVFSMIKKYECSEMKSLDIREDQKWSFVLLLIKHIFLKI